MSIVAGFFGAREMKGASPEVPAQGGAATHTQVRSAPNGAPRPAGATSLAACAGLACFIVALFAAAPACVPVAYAASVMQGAYMAWLFYCWAPVLLTMGYRLGLATIAVVLAASGAAGVLLGAAGLLGNCVVAVVCASVTLAVFVGTGTFVLAAAQGSMDTADAGAVDEGLCADSRSRSRFGALVLFAGFALAVCCMGTPGSAPGNWGLAALLAGSVLGCVALLAPSPRLFGAVFAASAAAICLVAILTLTFSPTAAAMGHIAMTFGFWILQATALGMVFPAPSSIFDQGSRGSAMLCLSVLSLSQSLGTALNHLLPQSLWTGKSTASTLLLVMSLLAAFYALGRRSSAVESVVEGGSDSGLWDGMARTYGLTSREAELMALIARGNTLKSAADTLGVTLNTAKTYRTNLYAKLGIHSRQELVDLAAASGAARPGSKGQCGN